MTFTHAFQILYVIILALAHPNPPSTRCAPVRHRKVPITAIPIRTTDCLVINSLTVRKTFVVVTSFVPPPCRRYCYRLRNLGRLSCCNKSMLCGQWCIWPANVRLLRVPLGLLLAALIWMPLPSVERLRRWQILISLVPLGDRRSTTNH